jgi:hypothetical protein
MTRKNSQTQAARDEKPGTPEPFPEGKPSLDSTSSSAIETVLNSAVNAAEGEAEKPTSIRKPKTSKLSQFRSANLQPEKVDTLLTGLPHYSIADAKDWVRLHPDEASYWSEEYCFVNVPVQGQKKDTLHLIGTNLAALLPPGRVQKFRLALASKPHDIFFVAHVPTQNLDNEWNRTHLQGCEQAKKLWTMATSQRERGIDGYKIDSSRAEKEGKKPFPDPNWPKATLDELIEATFAGRMILEETDPAWLRLVGGAQKLS